MEKRTAHYPLWRVRELVAAKRVTLTRSAREGAVALGFDMAGLLEVIQLLAPSEFYKSMTTYADHTVWQDVYRPLTRHGWVYLKLTVSAGLLVVTFKAR
ncbi:type II toxin-antitoxin system MqsR family toxin [Cupriavidus taiwanensis]|uniref:type II toxin-antitoxin system MqsR family toxin n=1 Tax=Cupriavidus taiwanensis TaxID=164546 RepID=UPI0025406CB6|nr:type II toxin-antitoxin system MqsR family toxin [Cupriavidus taiwanensis]MDK3023309.1 type II toxin-antitoxin system MqsR family toxin [Cupriavidus taiwanensis]